MIKLQKFGREHVADVVGIQEAITKQPVPETWTRMIEHHLAESESLGFVALRDGKVVGFVIGEAKGEGFGVGASGWIEVVGVEPRAMGEGIGKALVGELLEAFRQREITSIYTSVRWDAVDMLSFFKSVGFGRSDFINLVRRL